MITIRCSELGDAMTNSRDKKRMGATSEKCFVNSFVRQVYEKYEDTSNVFCEKGELLEPESIVLLSALLDIELKKYDGPTITNGYITGSPDVIIRWTNPVADQIRDVKNSFSVHTHLRKKSGGIDSANEWQVKGYCFLTGCSNGAVDHFVLNSPDKIIQKVLLKLSYANEGDTPLWEEIQTIKNHCVDKKHFEATCERLGRLPNDRNSLAVFKSFVDFPESLRHFSFPVTFTSEDEKAIIRRVYEGNEYLKKIGLQ